MMKSPFTITEKISEAWAGRLLRDYLLKEIKLSRRALKTIKFGEGMIEVNGEPKTVRYLLKSDDVVSITFPHEETSPSLIAEDMPLIILYEDEHTIVINKPADLPVIPSQKYSTGTLANGVLAHLEKQGLPYTVHTVTRLDRDTSGVMLIAKHRLAHDFFSKMQKDHDIHRRYLAIVEGTLVEEQGIIDAPIGRKDDSIIEREVRDDGKAARTRYSVISRHEGYTAVSVKLETGRTHQIRVHFKHLGHPLAGDDLYGGSLNWIGRHALHSFELSYLDPFTKQKRLYQADPPEDILKLLGQGFQMLNL